MLVSYNNVIISAQAISLRLNAWNHLDNNHHHILHNLYITFVVASNFCATEVGTLYLNLKKSNL